MTSLMLTAAELERLTGRKRPGAQERWLKHHGLRYSVNECGEVIVARELAERFLGVAPKASEREPDLDWPAMREAGIVARP